jgi:hypothetical protein
MPTSATQKGTARYAKRFSGIAAPGHFRETQNLVVSSLGIGTYLGQPDDKTDGNYAASVIAAVENGLNVIDTAINYRFQRSERSITPPSSSSRKKVSRATNSSSAPRAAISRPMAPCPPTPTSISTASTSSPASSSPMKSCKAAIA